MANNATFRVQATHIGAGIATFLIDASEMAGTFRIADTFRSTMRSNASESSQT